MILTKLKEVIDGRKLSPEDLAKLSDGKFSNMSVRRAMAGENVHVLIAEAIAKTLRVDLKDLGAE